MPFDLFQAGTGRKECAAAVKANGCNQLLSQLNERRPIMAWVAYKREHPESKSKLFIDSGAFSAHTKGKTVDVDDYINFMNEIDDVVYVFAQVDKIPGRFGQPKTAQELADAPRESWENYLYMKDRVKSRDKLLPIFHQGEDFKWLENMLEYTHEDGKHIPYIGISPANDVSVCQKKKWLEHVFSTIAKSSNPNVKTHAFGMTSLNVLEQFPFTSADSTSWLLSGANGGIMVNGHTYSISEKSVHHSGNIAHASAGAIEGLSEKVEKFGYTLEQLKNSAMDRQIFNLLSLKEWADNYQYRGKTIYKESLFGGM